MPIKSAKNVEFFFTCPKDHSTQKKLVPRSKGRVFCCPWTDTRTLTKVDTECTLSGFQDYFLQPIIKYRPNTVKSKK